MDDRVANESRLERETVDAPGASELDPRSPAPTSAGLAVATRRWLYVLVIAVAAAQGLANILTATVVYSPARWPENRPPHSPMFSANDRSRWVTVWSLVERGTYRIDEIIREPGWDTIDKVRYQDHFYSSKPPLLSTIAAGAYWGLHRSTGLDLLTETHETVHWLLLILNWVPWITALGLLAVLVERYGRTDWSRLFLVVAAASGTFLTTFLITFNNHTVAACSVVFALVPALSILIDRRGGAWRFALAGFWAGFTVCNELPACAFGAALFVLLARRSLRQTLSFFVPAALVPLAAFFYTNWLCTGGIMPFYASFGSATNDYYKYVIDGVPSYWMNPSAVDRGESSAFAYFVNCTIGHHGIFSLSPIFLLTVAGWLLASRRRTDPLRGMALLSFVLTVWVLAFYLTRTDSYNYGGVTSGLRWSFWLIPLWLFGLVPVLDAWGDRILLRIISVLLLAVSVFSATFPHHNPWQQPWLQDLFATYPATPATEDSAPRSQSVWFELPRDEPADPQDYWIELEGTSVDGTRQVMRLALGEAPSTEQCVVLASNSEIRGQAPTAQRMLLDRRSFTAGSPLPKLLVEPDSSHSADRTAALRFLSGLPQAKVFVVDRVRYLKIPLRKDAFECEVAVASTLYRLREDSPVLRYRRLVWWSREVPFGVVQIEDTVTDPQDNAIIHRQRWTAVRVGRMLPKD